MRLLREHPMWQDAQLLRETAREIRRWMRDPRDCRECPVRLAPGQTPQDKINELIDEAARLENMVAFDEEWFS